MSSLQRFFQGCKKLKTIKGIENLNTDNVTDMSYMFSGCSSLTSLDVSGFKTDNVTDMSYMFSGCSGLTSLDVSGFKTDNVTDMDYMFYGCSGLTSLDLSGFKTNIVSNMGSMFRGCSDLSTIYVSERWNMSNVKETKAMFSYCNNIIGGAGTTYDWQHTEGEYARIDGGPDNPGYFTYKAPHLRI